MTHAQYILNRTVKIVLQAPSGISSVVCTHGTRGKENVWAVQSDFWLWAQHCSQSNLEDITSSKSPFELCHSFQTAGCSCWLTRLCIVMSWFGIAVGWFQLVCVLPAVDRWFLSWGLGGLLGVKEGLLQNDAQQLYYFVTYVEVRSREQLCPLE